MDAMAGLLDGPRARGAFLLRALMAPPWSVRIQDEAPLSLVAMVSGEAWVLTAGDRIRLGPGDIVVAKGPDHYTVADDPGTAPQVVIHPGQRCTTADGHEVARMTDLGVRTWGNDPGGPTEMLIGTYQLSGEVSRRLLTALPAMLVLGEHDWDSRLVPVLRSEVDRDLPGQEVVLDRLLDLLLIAVLRAWLDRPDAGAPGWYAAQSDPVVGKALRLMYDDPARQWTVASLATAVGVSRAALARRFQELVGEPPMAYLTTWRLTLAADLLREPDSTIGEVARQVGYGSAFALSAAFKRVRGISPQDHRRRPVPA
jgi:AraC-like DNA-binding protein